jgi:hypothetical protein
VGKFRKLDDPQGEEWPPKMVYGVNLILRHPMPIRIWLVPPHVAAASWEL